MRPVCKLSAVFDKTQESKNKHGFACSSDVARVVLPKKLTMSMTQVMGMRMKKLREQIQDLLAQLLVRHCKTLAARVVLPKIIMRMEMKRKMRMIKLG